MALVPSGKHRIMHSQMFKSAQFDPSGQQKNTQPQPQLDPRLEVEQEAMGAQQPEQQNQAAMPTPDQQNPELAQDGMPGEEATDPQAVKPGTDAEGGESDIKDAWHQMLVDLGVPDRTLDNLEKQLYSEQTDLASNTIKGHYMIPTYTQHGKVTKNDAFQLARKMEHQFGLASIMKLEGRNWRIDFQTRPKVELQQGGSSFDELHKSQQKAASAMTIGEMLMAQHHDLYETMRKFVPQKGKYTKVAQKTYNSSNDFYRDYPELINSHRVSSVCPKCKTKSTCRCRNVHDITASIICSDCREGK